MCICKNIIDYNLKIKCNSINHNCICNYLIIKKNLLNSKYSQFEISVENMRKSSERRNIQKYLINIKNIDCLFCKIN